MLCTMSIWGSLLRSHDSYPALCKAFQISSRLSLIRYRSPWPSLMAILSALKICAKTSWGHCGTCLTFCSHPSWDSQNWLFPCEFSIWVSRPLTAFITSFRSQQLLSDWVSSFIWQSWACSEWVSLGEPALPTSRSTWNSRSTCERSFQPHDHVNHSRSKQYLP